MWKALGLLLVALIACWMGGIVAARQQVAVIFVPPGFNSNDPLFEELVWRLVRGAEAKVMVVTPDAELAQALDQRLLEIEREIAQSVREGQAPGGVEVTEGNRQTCVVQYQPGISPRPAALETHFDKVIFFDSWEWWSALETEDVRAGYSEEIGWYAEQGALFGAWGYGVLPLVESGLLPHDAVVAIPPDENLANMCRQYSVVAVEPQRPWSVDMEGRITYTPHAVYWQGDGWGLFTSSIPSYLYGPEDYDHFQEIYGPAIGSFMDGLEGAYYGELSPGTYWDISEIPPWSGEMVAVPPPEAGLPDGEQTAVVCLPPSFYGQLGYHASEFKQVAQGLLDEGASQIVVVPWDPLQAPEVERLADQVDPTGDIVTVFPWEELPPNTGYDKAIWLGGMGWYPLAYHELPEDEEEGILEGTREIAERADTIAAVGTGLYPLIMSGVFPPWTPVAVYPCMDLMETCVMNQVEPLPPQGQAQQGPDGRPLPPAKLLFAQADGKRFFTASIPDGWYAPGEEDLLLQHYGAALDAFVTYLEQAWRGEIAPGWTTEVAAGAAEGAEAPAQPTPRQVLVISFPSFHDQELQVVTDFLGEQGIPWTMAAWDEARGAWLSQCSPPGLPGQYGYTLQPEIWAWCADASEYDMVFIVGGQGVPRLFPCRAGTPSQAKEQLFDLLRAFVEAGKPVFAFGTAPVVLAEAGLLNGYWATVYQLRGDEINCLAGHGAMVRTPHGMPRAVMGTGVFDRGIATFYAQEHSPWGLADQENLRNALLMAYEEALDWVQAGSPSSWPVHPPEW